LILTDETSAKNKRERLQRRVEPGAEADFSFADLWGRASSTGHHNFRGVFSTNMPTSLSNVGRQHDVEKSLVSSLIG
jgi:hypothetical protein